MSARTGCECAVITHRTPGAFILGSLLVELIPTVAFLWEVHHQSLTVIESVLDAADAPCRQDSLQRKPPSSVVFDKIHKMSCTAMAYNGYMACGVVSR